MFFRVGESAAADRSEPGQRTRLARMMASESRAAKMLDGCIVTTTEGELLGQVTCLMVDRRSRHLRFVMVACAGSDAVLALPWKSLYFDPAATRLVFCNWP